MVAITVVTPDGKRRRVDAHHHADLFRALRGAGGGNFGIATRFELRVHHAPRAAFFRGSLPGGADAIAAWQAWAPETDPRLTALLQLGSDGAVNVLGQYLGSEAELSRLLGPLRRAGASLTTGTLGLRPAAGALGQRPHQRRARASARSRTTSRTRCPRTRASALRRRARPQPLQPPLRRLRRRRDGDPHPRTPATRSNTSPTTGDTAGLRRLHVIVAPYANGAYVNDIDPDLRGWRRAYYGRDLARLEAVRERYDPDRRFRFPRSI